MIKTPLELACKQMNHAASNLTGSRAPLARAAADLLLSLSLELQYPGTYRPQLRDRLEQLNQALAPWSWTP